VNKQGCAGTDGAGSPKPASKPGSLYAAVILLASALEGRNGAKCATGQKGLKFSLLGGQVPP
jgi:hypothetical protein